MYRSNQARQRQYLKERASEERINDATQNQLYTQLAKEAATDEQASNIADLATRVGTQLLNPAQPNALSSLLKAITDNRLPAFMQAAKTNNNPQLSGIAKVVQSVIKTPDYTRKANDMLAKLVQQGKQNNPEMVAHALAEAVKNNPMFKRQAAANNSEYTTLGDIEGTIADLGNVPAGYLAEVDDIKPEVDDIKPEDAFEVDDTSSYVDPSFKFKESDIKNMKVATLKQFIASLAPNRQIFETNPGKGKQTFAVAFDTTTTKTIKVKNKEYTRATQPVLASIVEDILRKQNRIIS